CKTTAPAPPSPDGATLLGRSIRIGVAVYRNAGPGFRAALNPGLLQMLLSSALEQRRKGLVEIFNRHCARVPFAIDEEGRGCLDFELGRAVLRVLLDFFEQRLVFKASIEALLRETRLFGDGEQRRDWFPHHPFLLKLEQSLDQLIELVSPPASCQHVCRLR